MPHGNQERTQAAHGRVQSEGIRTFAQHNRPVLTQMCAPRDGVEDPKGSWNHGIAWSALKDWGHTVCR
jgi:hypothetical protein